MQGDFKKEGLLVPFLVYLTTLKQSLRIFPPNNLKVNLSRLVGGRKAGCSRMLALLVTACAAINLNLKAVKFSSRKAKGKRKEIQTPGWKGDSQLGSLSSKW